MKILFLILIGFLLLTSCSKTKIDEISTIDSPPIFLKVEAADKNDRLFTSDIILVQ